MLPPDEFASTPFFNFDSPTTLQNSWNVMPSNMQMLCGNTAELPSCQIHSALHEMNPQQSSSVSNNCTSDEAEQQQYSIINERKQRRMISNRESARRSRMRKQKHLYEMWSQVICLRSENQALFDKYNHVSESLNDAVMENAKLKDEVSQLRKMVSNLQSASQSTVGKDLEDIPCNTDNAKETSSNNSSINLLE